MSVRHGKIFSLRKLHLAPSFLRISFCRKPPTRKVICAKLCARPTQPSNKMTQSDLTSPAVHNISFIGITGAMFSCLAVGLFLYWEAFVTTSWYASSNQTHITQDGLWQSCSTVSNKFSGNPWFIASQTLFSAVLFGLVLCFILGVIYLSANKASKNLTIIALVFLDFATCALGLSGLILLGTMTPPDRHLSWSYGIAILALAFFLVGGILAVFQIKKSNVQVC